MTTEEIRYYKGKYKVKIVTKSKGNYLVKSLEIISFKNPNPNSPFRTVKPTGYYFITVPRLLWRKKKQHQTDFGDFKK